MNIFILSNCPKEAARFHCDKHCIKMILESCQLLSSAINIHSNNSISGTYKTTHINHPCSIWARASRENFNWLCELTEELFFEYTRRYGKTHKSYSVFEVCKQNSNILPKVGLTKFPQAMPDIYRNENAVVAYRNYYISEKRDICSWKIGNVPNWFV